jgi:hypothetical protein
LAFDTSVSPPILYVADTGNNRVLAWRNPANLQSGAMADKVIGRLKKPFPNVKPSVVKP